MQVFCSDRQQHPGTDERRDGDGYTDSSGEPGGAGPVLHREHHPNTMLHGNIQGITHTLSIHHKLNLLPLITHLSSHCEHHIGLQISAYGFDYLT